MSSDSVYQYALGIRKHLVEERPCPREGFPDLEPVKAFHDGFFLTQNAFQKHFRDNIRSATAALSDLPRQFYIVKEMEFNTSRLDGSKKFGDKTITTMHRWYLQVVVRPWMDVDNGVAVLPVTLKLPDMPTPVHHTNYWTLPKDREKEEAYIAEMETAMLRQLLPDDAPGKFLSFAVMMPLERHALGPCKCSLLHFTTFTWCNDNGGDYEDFGRYC